ncbi:hypothetical protein N7540_005955 [Penicillium herquei]|nr:hypothetical protein N7540_005955 [Penicillium herquei]
MPQHLLAAQANVPIQIRIQIIAFFAVSRVLPSYPTVALILRSVSSYIADMLQWELYELDKRPEELWCLQSYGNIGIFLLSSLFMTAGQFN